MLLVLALTPPDVESYAGQRQRANSTEQQSRPWFRLHRASLVKRKNAPAQLPAGRPAGEIRSRGDSCFAS
jgi:hypothetical protein